MARWNDNIVVNDGLWPAKQVRSIECDARSGEIICFTRHFLPLSKTDLAWRYLGMYIDCDLDEENDESERRLAGNGSGDSDNCERILLWAAVSQSDYLPIHLFQ